MTPAWSILLFPNPQSLHPRIGLGSVRALTNGSGSVTDRYAYDAFGSELATSGAGTANAYRFTGEQQDAALGMYYKAKNSIF